MVPRDQWGEHERRAVVRPLDLQREVDRFGGDQSSRGQQALNDEASHIHIQRNS